MSSVIRAAADPDLDAVAAIYDQEVAHSIATFDQEPRPRTYWESRLASVEVGDHLLVAEDQVLGVVGYAYSSSYRPRPAYLHTRETSVYLAEAARGRGLGRALYDKLIDRMREDDVHTAVAVIALPNPASVALHEAVGFRHVGTLGEVGRKFGRWIDTAWFQLDLAVGATEDDDRLT
ncbi:MAG: N-acetyltransferase [Nocardioidaceae bacterium]|nr:N-acetyltransferase [Nocardioidaceae bacterium]